MHDRYNHNNDSLLESPHTLLLCSVHVICIEGGTVYFVANSLREFPRQHYIPQFVHLLSKDNHLFETPPPNDRTRPRSRHLNGASGHMGGMWTRSGPCFVSAPKIRQQVVSKRIFRVRGRQYSSSRSVVEIIAEI